MLAGVTSAFLIGANFYCSGHSALPNYYTFIYCKFIFFNLLHIIFKTIYFITYFLAYVEITCAIFLEVFSFLLMVIAGFICLSNFLNFSKR